MSITNFTNTLLKSKVVSVYMATRRSICKYCSFVMLVKALTLTTG